MIISWKPSKSKSRFCATFHAEIYNIIQIDFCTWYEMELHILFFAFSIFKDSVFASLYGATFVIQWVTIYVWIFASVRPYFAPTSVIFCIDNALLKYWKSHPMVQILHIFFLFMTMSYQHIVLFISIILYRWYHFL